MFIDFSYLSDTYSDVYWHTYNGILFEQAASSEKTDVQKMILNDSDWLQQTVYKILNHHFTHTTNLFDLLQLLKILDTESAVLLFKFDGKDCTCTWIFLFMSYSNVIIKL